MLKFYSPEYLYLLILLPLLCLLYYYSNWQRRRRLARYGDVELLKQLMPDVSKYRPSLKFWLTLAGMAMLILALARPQYGSKSETVVSKGIEAVIALDISNSMMAQDVAPSRLDKSKKIISKLLDGFDKDKVGLIVFAGDAFVQLPITNDFISAKMFLDNIDPSLITKQGTDVGSAINLAAKSFTPNKAVGKAIIVITDGENHEGGAEEAAKAAAENGMKVYVLGVGTSEGTPIPAGEGSDNYLTDKQGQVVVTRLNEQMAQQIALAGNGAYIHVDNTNKAQDQLQEQLDKLSKADVENNVYTDFEEQFQWFAWVAFILLFVEMIILMRKSKLTRNFNLFK